MELEIPGPVPRTWIALTLSNFYVFALDLSPVPLKDNLDDWLLQCWIFGCLGIVILPYVRTRYSSANNPNYLVLRILQYIVLSMPAGEIRTIREKSGLPEATGNAITIPSQSKFRASNNSGF